MSGSLSSLREANRAQIVDVVRKFGGLTQVEISESTGLSAATVSSIVKELARGGAVEVRATVRSGRRAQLVTLTHRVGLAVGLQIGNRQLRLLLGDAGHEVLAERTLPLPNEHKMDTTLDRAALLVVDLLERIGAGLDEVLGIGVGLPAPVDEATGMISVRGIMRGWDEVHVAQVLAKRLGRPVFVDNDANLGALAESTMGASRPYRDSVYVRASYGVGAGIVLAGQLHRGAAGVAGEIGHVQVHTTGAVCRCGRRGCLDTVVGAAALLDELRPTHGSLALRDLVTGALEGDELLVATLADVGARIGTVVAGLAQAVDPQCVVVGGEMAEAGELLIGPLREAVRRGALLNQIAPLEVVPAELGQRAEVMGALLLALQSTDLLGAGTDDEPTWSTG